MAYSIADDVRRAIAPDLANPSIPPSPPTNTAADLGNDTISAQIDEADARIDGFLSARYQTPVAVLPQPVLLTYWSRDLAAYLSLLVWRKNQNIDPTDPLQLRYNQVIAELTAVRNGNANLPIPENEGDGGVGGGGDPSNIIPCGLFVGSGLDIYGSSWPDRSRNMLDGHWYDW